MKIKSTKNLYSTNWLALKSVTYEGKTGKEMKWDYVSRTGTGKIATIIARTKKTGKYLLISQARVPVQKRVIEFPAGLVDEGETYEEAAVRELKEETGYQGGIFAVHDEVVKSPGLSNETTAIIEMLIDENDQEEVAREDSEDIQLFWVKKAEAQAIFSKLNPENYIVDALVKFYFLGTSERNS